MPSSFPRCFPPFLYFLLSILIFKSFCYWYRCSLLSFSPFLPFPEILSSILGSSLLSHVFPYLIFFCSHSVFGFSLVSLFYFFPSLLFFFSSVRSPSTLNECRTSSSARGIRRRRFWTAKMAFCSFVWETAAPLETPSSCLNTTATRKSL